MRRQLNLCAWFPRTKRGQRCAAADQRLLSRRIRPPQRWSGRRVLNRALHEPAAVFHITGTIVDRESAAGTAR